MVLKWRDPEMKMIEILGSPVRETAIVQPSNLHILRPYRQHSDIDLLDWIEKIIQRSGTFGPIWSSTKAPIFRSLVG
jgi:hypothetical protein